jgi:hypothetical protein
MRALGFRRGWLLLVWAAIGCAYQDATVRRPAAAAVASGLRIVGSPAVVLVTPFIDARSDRHRCGMKKAWSQESARVECGGQPGEWLAELLAQELRSAGFQVYEKQAPPGLAAVRIEGILTQLFIEPDVASDYYVFYAKTHYIPEADVGVTLIAKGDRFEAERRFYFKGAGEYMSGGLESNFQRALDESVKEAVRDMTWAIADLVEVAPGFEAYACSVAPAMTVRR